jgi:hypothetical protein
MLAHFICMGLIVFAITLTVTKSEIMGNKREFVKKRYEASHVDGQQPGFIHRWWHAMWTCPMCLGFWAACAVVPFWSTSYGYVGDVLITYGLNWLFHCVENFLFQTGKIVENLLKQDE